MPDHDVVTVTDATELATTLAAADEAGRGWCLEGVATPGDRLRVRLGGRLALVSMVGGAMVEVGGGVALATLAQYVQTQTGVAPGWPLDATTSVALALAGGGEPQGPIDHIVEQMSQSIVEVEVARASTRATEWWDRDTLFHGDDRPNLPSDAVVAVVIVRMAAAAAAVDHRMRRAARNGPGTASAGG